MNMAIDAQESSGSRVSIRFLTARSYSCPVVTQWQQHTAQQMGRSEPQPNSMLRHRPAPGVGGTRGVAGETRSKAPRWVSWAIGDFTVKLVIAVFALIPYRVIMQRFMPYRPQPV